MKSLGERIVKGLGYLVVITSAFLVGLILYIVWLMTHYG